MGGDDKTPARRSIDGNSDDPRARAMQADLTMLAEKERQTRGDPAAGKQEGSYGA